MTDSRKLSLRHNASNWASTAAWLCFAAVLVLIPFRYHIQLLARPLPLVGRDYTDFQLFASDMAAVGMLLMWVLSLVLRPRRLNLGPRHVWIPLAGLTLAGWISTISSYDPSLSAYHGIRLFGLFWFYVYIVNEVRSLSWVIVPAGIQAAIQAPVALAQFLYQHSVGLQQIGEQVLDPSAPGTSVITANGVRLLRAYGLSDHPNILGGCLAFGLVLLILPSLTRSTRLPAYAVLIPASAALLITFSRAAWFAFAAGLAILAGVEILNRRSALPRLISLGMACLVVPISIVVAYRSFFGVRLGASDSFATLTAEQQSIGERLILVESALPIYLDHPVIGIGLGSAPLALKAYYPEFETNYEPPHWTLFNSTLETGALGGICYLALIIFPFFFYIYHRRALLRNQKATLAVALLVSVSVVGSFDY